MNENNSVVLLLGTKNKFLPSLTYLPEPNRNINVLCFLYFCLGFCSFLLKR